MALSPDCKRVAAFLRAPVQLVGPRINREPPAEGPSGLILWDIVTGEEVRRLDGETRDVLDFAFSPDSKSLACTASDGIIKTWDLETGEELHAFRSGAARGRMPAFVPDARFTYSPDGTRIVCEADSNAVEIWDARTGEMLRSIRKDCRLSGNLVFSPCGRWFASGTTDHQVKGWDAETGQEVFSFRGHSGPIAAVAFSPDSKRIASGCAAFASEMTNDGKVVVAKMREFGNVKIWDMPSSQDTLTLELPGYGNDLSAMPGQGRGVAFSPDSNRVASGAESGVVCVWETATGRQVSTYGEPGPIVQGRAWCPVSATAFSPDGKWIAAAKQDGTIRVWDAGSGHEYRTLRGHSGPVFSLDFSPDSRRIASGSTPFSAGSKEPGARWTGPQEIKVWELATGQESVTLKWRVPYIPLLVSCVAFSPDGTRLATGSVGVLRSWDLASGRQLFELVGHHQGDIALAYSPDGGRIATASSQQPLKIFDAQTGELAHTVYGHDGWVSCVAYSPDGKRLASGSQDTTVKIWETSTWRELLTLRGHQHWVASVAWSPDGTRIASRDHRRVIRVWRAVVPSEGYRSETEPEAQQPRGAKTAQRIIAVPPEGLDQQAPSTVATAKPSVADLAGRPWIVLSWAPPGTARPDLWLFSPDSHTRHNITQSPEYSETAPHFSPDGRRIVFLRHANTWQERSVWLCNVDGTDLRQVVACQDGREHFPSAVWVSSERICYVRDPVYDQSPDGEIWEVDADRASSRMLFRTRDVVKQGFAVISDASRDGGRRVAYVNNGDWAPNFNVYAIDFSAAAGTISPVWIDKDHIDGRALLSRDGKRIAWRHSFTPGAYREPEYYGVGIAVLDENDRWVPKLQPDESVFVTPVAWSPADSLLLCAQVRSPDAGPKATLFLMNEQFQTVQTVAELDSWDAFQSRDVTVSRLGDWAMVPADLGPSKRVTPELPSTVRLESSSGAAVENTKSETAGSATKQEQPSPKPKRKRKAKGPVRQP